MADNKKKKGAEDEVLVNVESTLSRTEEFIEKNQKVISYVVIGLVAIVGGIWAYLNLYLAPREKSANEEMVQAVMAFENDSLQLALNGAANWAGFLEVAESYGGTKTGNVAHFYAGVSYLNLKQFENAIIELDKFSPKEPTLKCLKFGAIGDAFHEIGQPAEALEYYNRAVSSANNEFLTPFFLKKAGMTAEMLEEYDKAYRAYKRIEDEFSDSREAGDIFKFTARVEGKR